MRLATTVAVPLPPNIEGGQVSKWQKESTYLIRNDKAMMLVTSTKFASPKQQNAELPKI